MGFLGGHRAKKRAAREGKIFNEAVQATPRTTFQQLFGGGQYNNKLRELRKVKQQEYRERQREAMKGFRYDRYKMKDNIEREKERIYREYNVETMRKRAERAKHQGDSQYRQALKEQKRAEIKAEQHVKQMQTTQQRSLERAQSKQRWQLRSSYKHDVANVTKQLRASHQEFRQQQRGAIHPPTSFSSSSGNRGTSTRRGGLSTIAARR